MKTKYLLPLALTLMIGGCTVDLGDDSTLGSDNDTVTLSLSDFEGTWVGACTYDDSDSDDLKYVIKTYIITTTSITSQSTEYAEDDATCSGDATLVAKFEGEIEAGETVEVSDGEANALEIDLTLQVAKLQMNDTTNVDYFNTNSICGGGWTAEEEKDITTACDGDSVLGDFVSGLPFSIYTIVNVEGQSLSLGDDSGANDGTTDANRPTSLSSTTYALSE
jgi:hypothetical protein